MSLGEAVIEVVFVTTHSALRAHKLVAVTVVRVLSSQPLAESEPLSSMTANVGSGIAYSTVR